MPLTREEKDTMVKQYLCNIYGHPRIVSSSFGYIHCARCEEQIADSLGGYFNPDGYVLMNHDCNKCKKAYAALEDHELFMSPNPFTKLYVKNSKKIRKAHKL